MYIEPTIRADIYDKLFDEMNIYGMKRNIVILSLNKEDSNETITKAMSAEQFEEYEHPRDASGKFTDKPGSATASSPAPDKGAWGGFRKGAGRLPKDPIDAKARLEERFRVANPNITDQELNQRLSDFAVANNKPDLLMYINNPKDYMKQREEELMMAQQDRYNKVRTKTGYVKGPVTAEDIEDANSGVKASASRWKQLVTQTRDVASAYKVYKSENEEEDAKIKAKLLLGTALLVKGLGIWYLMRGRPSAKGAGLILRPGKAGLGRGATIADVPDFTGAVNPVEIKENPKLFRLLRIIKPPAPGVRSPFEKDPLTEIYREETGSFNVLLGNAIARIGKLTGKRVEPGEYAIHMGEAWKGYFPYRRPYKIFRKPQGYKMEAGVGSAETGLVLAEVKPGAAEKSLPEINHINLARSRRIKVKDPKTGKITESFILPHPDDVQPGGFIPPGLQIVDAGNGVRTWAYRPGADSKSAFAEWLSGKLGKGRRKLSKLESKKGANKFNWVTNITEEDFPDYLAAKWTPDELASQDAAYKAYQGWSQFLHEKFFGDVSRGTLAALTVSAGAGTAGTYYYFQRDIERYLGEYSKKRKEEASASSASIQTAIPKKKTGSNTKDEIRLAKMREREAKAKESLERTRQQIITQWINEGFRDPLEGARTEATLRPETVQKYYSPFLTKVFMEETFQDEEARKAGYTYSSAGLKKFQSDLTSPDPEVRAKAQALKDHIMNRIREEFLKAQEQEDASKAQAKGIDVWELVIKELEDVQEFQETNNQPYYPLNDAIPLIVDYLTDIFVNISQANKTAIEAGIPGHSDFEQLNDILTEIYQATKDNLKSYDNKIQEKSMDSSDISGVMNSQQDASGGLFTGGNKKIYQTGEKCPKCGKIATADIVKECDEPQCPYNWVESIETKE